MFTRIPCPISSLAIVNASASSADLAMLYGAPLARMCATSLDEIITMCPRPRSRICGSSCWHRRAALKVWVIISRCSSDGSVSTTVLPRLATPALWTMMSTKPNAASAASASASAPSRSPSDARTDSARPPAALIAATVSAAAASSRR